MKRWGRYVNPNTRHRRSGPVRYEDGVLITPGKRGTSHYKAYRVDWRTWYIFLWLVSRTVERHPQPFNKTARGKARRAERKFIRESHHEQADE